MSIELDLEMLMLRKLLHNYLPKLNIKTRILVFVVVFELIAYSSIQFFNNYTYSQELTTLSNDEIQESFFASIAKINNLSKLMEANAIDLAITGEHL